METWRIIRTRQYQNNMSQQRRNSLSSGSSGSCSSELKFERGRVRSVSFSEQREDEYKMEVVNRIQGLVRQFEVRQLFLNC